MLESEGKRFDVPARASFASALRFDAIGQPQSGDKIKPSECVLPQTIAHRGYKAAFPENTMAAFRSAVEIGAHAIETDLHLSKDGVVVMSHDGTLKRCFGIDAKIADCDWSYLSTLRTLREPHEPMPRLVDLLEYLAQPETERVWLLLDIKRDDDPFELLSRVAANFATVATKRAWNERIVMGCWTIKYIKLCQTLLPGFPIAFIGWSLTYARALLRVPDIHFNLLQQRLASPFGASFLKKAKKCGRLVFDWTVNDEEWMERSIQKKLDGVITDDPKLFLEICDSRQRRDLDCADKQLAAKKSVNFVRMLRHVVQVVGFQIAATLLTVILLIVMGSPGRQIRKHGLMQS